jgi:DNA-binding transcriptional LysR family regulator
MEFDDLRTFLAVAETRSVSQAARQLFLTQPVVTRRLQRLENTLGSTLLDRRRRPFRLTPTGYDVLERCRRVLQSVREVQATVARNGAPAGELKIGVAHALTEITMTGPLDLLRKKFSKVELRLTTGWSRALLEQVRSGALDAAVILLPEEDVLPAAVRGVEIGKEQLVVVAPKQKSNGRQKLAQMQGVSWILNPEGCAARAGLQRALQQAHVDMRVALETYNYELQLNLVARDRGWSLVPSRILQGSRMYSRLRVVQVDGLHFPLRIWSVTGEADMRLSPVIEQVNRELEKRLLRTRAFSAKPRSRQIPSV